MSAPAVPAPAPAPARGAAPRRTGSTPRTIGLLMVALVVASLGWGAAGAWTAQAHASAARAVTSTEEPVSVEARQMYQALSDADVTATTAFLAGPAEPLAQRQRYQADIARAGADLAALEKAGGSTQLRASLAALSTGLPVYTGYVSQAQAQLALGYQLTGGSFMQVASEQMHLTLLPAARTSYQQANAALAARSAQASGLPWVVVVLAASVLLGLVLLRTQRWLSRRTRRTFNLGLVGASVALAVAAVWLAVASMSARGDLDHAEAHGSAPAQALAQATITVQRARSDEVLNLISRSGSASFRGDFDAARQQAGPGRGSLLATAAAGSPNPTAQARVAAAERDASAWYAVSGKVFSLDLAANYAAETKLVIGSGPGSSGAGFDRLERDLGAASDTDQAAFSSGARAGADAFGGVALAFILAALIMAGACCWGLAQRLAEYR